MPPSAVAELVHAYLQSIARPGSELFGSCERCAACLLSNTLLQVRYVAKPLALSGSALAASRHCALGLGEFMVQLLGVCEVPPRACARSYAQDALLDVDSGHVLLERWHEQTQPATLINREGMGGIGRVGRQ